MIPTLAPQLYNYRTSFIKSVELSPASYNEVSLFPRPPSIPPLFNNYNVGRLIIFASALILLVLPHHIRKIEGGLTIIYYFYLCYNEANTMLIAMIKCNDNTKALINYVPYSPHYTGCHGMGQLVGECHSIAFAGSLLVVIIFIAWPLAAF